MKKIVASLALLLIVTVAVSAQGKAPAQAPAPPQAMVIPPCKCGCMEGKSCACKNCCERTADPTWTPAQSKVAAAGLCNCTGKADCTCASGDCFCRACSGRKAAQATPYTGTLNLAYALPAGTHGWGFRYSVITNSDLPAGTYDLVATPRASRAAVGYDTATIYRCPETGRRWRYTDQAGNWQVVNESVPFQTGVCTDGSCGTMSFGSCANGSCGTTSFSAGGGSCANGSCGTSRSFGLFRRR